jgi:hypothetical protein
MSIGMLFNNDESVFQGGILELKIHNGPSIRAAWDGVIAKEEIHKYKGWVKGFLSCDGFTCGTKPHKVEEEDEDGNVKMGVNRAGVPVPYTKLVGKRRRYNLYGRKLAVLICDDEYAPTFRIVMRNARRQETKVGPRMALVLPGDRE